LVRQDGIYWQVWDRGTQQWNYPNTSNFKITDMTLADFNGDGTTDVLRTAGGNWYVSWGGTSGWEFLNTSDLNPKNQLLADFNGDGKADVLSRQSPDP
jgi:FG-GAP-like repeat